MFVTCLTCRGCEGSGLDTDMAFRALDHLADNPSHAVRLAGIFFDQMRCTRCGREYTADELACSPEATLCRDCDEGD